MSRYTNNTGIPIGMAVMLAFEEYETKKMAEKEISVTGLLRPIRQLVLAARVPESDQSVDITSLIRSRLGTAVHNQFERAWKVGFKQALKDLGKPQRLIDRIIINPTPDDLAQNPDAVPVYTEMRNTRQVAGWTVSGEFDFVIEGGVEDVKVTSTFTYVKGTKDEDYILQGSMYRWINPTLIVQDTMGINYFFTDWSAFGLQQNPDNYPPAAVMQKRYALKSLVETENWIIQKLGQIERYWSSPDSDIPRCTDEELWRDDTVWKYYKNPAKKSRSTKNFTTRIDAEQRLADDGYVGEVVEVKGQAKACHYCPAITVCGQAQALVADGTLILKQG